MFVRKSYEKVEREINELGVFLRRDFFKTAFIDADPDLVILFAKFNKLLKSYDNFVLDCIDVMEDQNTKLDKILLMLDQARYTERG